MEGLRKRALVAIGLVLAAGVFIVVSAHSEPDPKTEDWMIANAPRSIPGFVMQGGVESSEYTYKMDERTYGELDPYGIVARVFENRETGEVYDTVLIASKSKDSFHDPRICFTAQGWTLANQWSESVETKTRGTAYMTVTVMDGPDGRNKLAAFLYRGQGKFYKSTSELKVGMFLEQLKGGGDLDGVFYRFIPMYESEDQMKVKNDLKKFIAEFLDAANESSQGYF